MPSPRRIPFSIGALNLALVILLSIAVCPTITVAAGNANLFGGSWVYPRRATKSRGPTKQVRATLATTSPTILFAAQGSNAAAALPGVTNPNQNAENHPPTAAEVWNDAAEALAAKILEHMTSGNALALTVKNISSLGDDDVGQVRRALRAKLRSHRARLTSSTQANADVLVTLSENAEGYLWIAEVRDHASPSVAGEDVAIAVVMVSVARPNPAERRPAAEPLSIRKTRIYQQSDPMLDVALLDNPTVGSAPSPVSVGAAARILVLGRENVFLYEQAGTPDAGGKNVRQWRAMQSAPITRLRPWPRDARGRIIVRTDSLFDAYLPGAKCSGALEPALTLECRESDEPWPLAGDANGVSSANSTTGLGPAAYFSPDRNFFDGRIKLDDGSEVKALPFLALVAMPPSAAIHAGFPGLSGRVPPAANAGQKPGTVGPAGWVISGLDGRAQVLNSNAEPLANVGGWGSQIAGLQSGCGGGWQVLASQARDSGEPDALQAYEIVNRKPVPVSGSSDFAGPITELWPLPNGSEAIAISRNLQSGAYEAFRISVACGQ